MFSEVKKPSIEDLPIDYLYHLFNNFFDFNSRVEAGKVSDVWAKLVVLSFNSKRCLIICDYEMANNRINALNLSKKKVSVVKMVSFNLIERTEAKDKTFISVILRKHRNLQTICICLKFTKCNNHLLDLISNNCSKSLVNLRIELSDCSVNNRSLVVSHEEILQFSEKIPNLKYLYIDFVTLFIQELSLQTIFTKWKNIETIIFHTPCFRGCVYNSEFENILSQEFSGEYFASVGPFLSKVELPGNVFNWNAINQMPNERQLKRLLVLKLNVNSIETICKKFSKLSFFGFSIENNLNEEDMLQLMVNIGGLHHLEQLYIAIMNGMAINKNCVKLLRYCSKLRSLQIDQTLIGMEGVDAIAKTFRNLENLELWTSGLNQNFHHCLTDTIVSGVKNLKLLKSINLRGQRNISDKSIANITSECRLLDTIDIRTTKAAIITLNVLIEKSKQSVKTFEVFIHETPISRLFSQEIKRFEICKHLLLSNEEYDCKINF